MSAVTVATGQRSWLDVGDEISGVLSAVSRDQMAEAARLLDRQPRWFFCGQGRSGLVAAMAAMRLMHAGFTAHVVGEATAPAVVPGDGLVAISATGETATTLHVARLARDLGAQVLAVTSRADSTLASLGQARIDLPTHRYGAVRRHVVRADRAARPRRAGPRSQRRRPAGLRRDAVQARQPAIAPPSSEVRQRASRRCPRGHHRLAPPCSSVGDHRPEHVDSTGGPGRPDRGDHAGYRSRGDVERDRGPRHRDRLDALVLERLREDQPEADA